MNPYYRDESAGITLYHGDCRKVLPMLDVVDVGLLCTDPPYGMKHEPTRRAGGSKRWGTERVTGDAEPFDPTPLLAYRRIVLWGANWYADRLPASGGWLVWDKTPRGTKQGFTASHAELAWTNIGGMVRKFAVQWGGEARNGESHLHPTQKPVVLMQWVLSLFTSPGELVLDPYMGSGPVLDACRLDGRRYVGVEVEEFYCEVAARRLEQGVLQFGE